MKKEKLISKCNLRYTDFKYHTNSKPCRNIQLRGKAFFFFSENKLILRNCDVMAVLLKKIFQDSTISKTFP